MRRPPPPSLPAARRSLPAQLGLSYLAAVIGAVLGPLIGAAVGLAGASNCHRNDEACLRWATVGLSVAVVAFALVMIGAGLGLRLPAVSIVTGALGVAALSAVGFGLRHTNAVYPAMLLAPAAAACALGPARTHPWPVRLVGVALGVVALGLAWFGPRVAGY